MALDWAKAFDSINSESMLASLRRFVIPEKFVKVVSSIYSGRVFEVRECGISSER